MYMMPSVKSGSSCRPFWQAEICCGESGFSIGDNLEAHADIGHSRPGIVRARAAI
jgi:hypothetical protein